MEENDKQFLFAVCECNVSWSKLRLDLDVKAEYRKAKISLFRVLWSAVTLNSSYFILYGNAYVPNIWDSTGASDNCNRIKASFEKFFMKFNKNICKLRSRSRKEISLVIIILFNEILL